MKHAKTMSATNAIKPPVILAAMRAILASREFKAAAAGISYQERASILRISLGLASNFLVFAVGPQRSIR
jgi:hypothetical protein